MLEKADTEESQDLKCALMCCRRLLHWEGDRLIHWNSWRKGFIWAADWISPFEVPLHRIPTWNSCLTSSDLISLKLLRFWSLPQIQALEEVAKCKRWEESKNYSTVYHQLLIFWEVTAAVPVPWGKWHLLGSRGEVPRQLAFVMQLSTLCYFTFSKCHADSFIPQSVTQRRACSGIPCASPGATPPWKPPGQCGALCEGALSWCLLRAQQRVKTKGLMVSGIKPCWSIFSLCPQAHCNF